MSGLAGRLATVRERIAAAARDAGRDPGDVQLIVVTKTHPVALIRELLDLGVTAFGENRHQEAREKARELAEFPVCWHFIGQLQTNKARQVRRYASVVHSVDRIELAQALADSEHPLECFLQVNLTADPNRGGVQPGGFAAFVDRVAAVDGLRVLGLMAVAPLGEAPERAFARLHPLRERLARAIPDALALSIGMSTDFVAAIASGATHLRIGSAITGERRDRR